MKKYLILFALFVLMQTAFGFAISKTTTVEVTRHQQDSLAEYTGKYQMQEGPQTLYADVYIENGKLTAKTTEGQVLVLDRISGDSFIVSAQNLPVRFIRDKDNKVFQVSVADGQATWIKVVTKASAVNNVKSAEYLGKYQITMNGQTAVIEISLKNELLWATQLWDGGSSPLNHTSGDEFMVVALKMPMKFVRDKDRNVTQMLLNSTDLFTKIKS